MVSDCEDRKMSYTQGELHGEKKRILVVDDFKDTLEIIQRTLEHEGYSVVAVGSVREAITSLSETMVDLVITDLKMPKTDGLHLVDYVKEKFREIPIILITGYPFMVEAKISKPDGILGILSKPFTENELVKTVREAIEKPEKHRFD